MNSTQPRVEPYSTCQWIGPDSEHTCTCSKPVFKLSYCKDHVWQVYQEGSAMRKRKKDIRVANSVWDIESAFNEAVAELEAEGEI